jgi:hypothetical protein
VNRREPVRNTGRASRKFLFESAMLMLPTSELERKSPEASGALRSSRRGMVSSSLTVDNCVDLHDSGIIQRSNKQIRIAIIDKAHDIQGEIFVVTAAVKELRSSAT